MYRTEAIGAGSKGRRSAGSRAMLFLAALLAALVFGSGVAFAATINCVAGADCLGTRDDDTLRGTVKEDDIFGRAGGDVIRGRDGSDELYGQGGSDRLVAGPGSEDRLTGGPGNDALDGGAGEDYYLFGSGWGKDTLVNDASSHNSLSFHDFYDQTASVTKGLTIRLTPGDGPEVKNLAGTSTIDWENDVTISSVHSGDGDDEITGNGMTNALFGYKGVDTINGAGGQDGIIGGPGEDTLSGGPGDDAIYASLSGDWQGSDVVNCGESPADHDVVYYDLFDQVADNCEETHLTSQLPNP